MTVYDDENFFSAYTSLRDGLNYNDLLSFSPRNIL